MVVAGRAVRGMLDAATELGAAKLGSQPVANSEDVLELSVLLLHSVLELLVNSKLFFLHIVL